MKVKELKFLESKQKELEKTLSPSRKRTSTNILPSRCSSSVVDDPKMMKGVEHDSAESAKPYKPKVGGLSEKGWSEKEMLSLIPQVSLFVAAIICKKCHEANYRNWLFD
ncbi:MAG: hypothetical protein KGZ49_10885 [Syntrophaceae bacterium]|nr:hypothetical protein [Syntrophaceae bacterium]